MFPPRTNRDPVEEDDPFDFPDLPDSFSDQNQSRGPSSSSSSSTAPLQLRKGLQSTVLGSGPGGIGVITKLNTKNKPNITHGSIKLKNKAVAKTWEDELDFEGDWGGTLKLKNKSIPKKVGLEEGGEMDGFDDDEEDWEGTLKSKLKMKPAMGTIKLGDIRPPPKPLGLGLPPRKVLPEADFDDLGFDIDEDIQVDKGKAKTPKKPSTKFFVRPVPKNLPGPEALDDLDVFDDFNEDEATIKASSAMKALLPPPRIRPPPPPVAQDQDDIDMDDDFALPLNLTNLTLATRPETTGRGPRTSIASTNTDWNSPTTSASNERWDSTPPSKRFSATSNTSLSDGPNSSKPPQTPGSAVEDEDMEDGLILPSKHFFKSTSKRELNSMLDRKRRPEYGSPSRRTTVDMDISMQEGLEDGLVFDDPKSELTRKRLVKSKEARSQIPIPTRKSPNGKPLPFGVPPPTIGRDSPSKRERTQSSVGMGMGHRHRHHSTGNSTLHGSPSYLASQGISGSGLPPPSGSGFKAFFSPTRPKSPLQSPGLKEKERSRSGQAFIPMRIPQTPDKELGRGEKGLRHQKSSSHLPSPTHTSSIIRKQSLSTLQDQPSGLPLPTFSSVSSLHSLAEEPSKPYATSSGSRLTNPTHASASKVKQRLPLHGIFPGPTSSSKFSGMPVPSISGSSSSSRSRLLHAQMKRRPYGDGSELEAIEDLEVGDEERGSYGSARSRASNRPSVRSVFPSEKKEKTRSGFSTHSNQSATPNKGKGRESEITIRGNEKEKDKGKEKEKEGSWGRKRGKRTPLLIKHLGGVERRKVVGEMTWNPAALRWEGNESALQDFDHVPTTSSARPALIPAPASPTNPNSYHTSAGTVKIVGNMQFDPVTMRWVALNPEDEVDPFADFELADDEGEGGRRNDQMSESEVSSTRHFSTTFEGDGVVSISEEMVAECHKAEERHRREIRGFVGSGGSWSRSEERREERRLWEIRNLALA